MPSPPSRPVTAAEPETIAAPLVEWYDRHARSLPWRVPPARSKAGERPDPYAVWLSEVMLQQTTVAAVAPRYERLLALWPDVRALADAGEEAVLREWAGLGYYSRARNLYACARTVVEEHGGSFPRTATELRALPGIGDYTAAAIAAIAFGEAVPVIDGNVERVVARLTALERPPARAKTEIREWVARAVLKERPGDFAQATMDLGATVCTPRSPACVVCPLVSLCAAARSGEPERWPLKLPKKVRPTRKGAAYVARRSDGALLMTRRPEGGTLAGTPAVPMSEWSSRRDGAMDGSAAPVSTDWREAGTARHGFTHFEIELTVLTARYEGEPPEGCWWSPDPETEGLTTLMRRVLEAVD